MTRVDSDVTSRANNALVALSDYWVIPVALIALLVGAGFLVLIMRKGFASLEANVGSMHVKLNAVDRSVNNTPGPPLIQRVIGVEETVERMDRSLAAAVGAMHRLFPSDTQLAEMHQEYIVCGENPSSSHKAR